MCFWNNKKKKILNSSWCHIEDISLCVYRKYTSDSTNFVLHMYTWNEYKWNYNSAGHGRNGNQGSQCDQIIRGRKKNGVGGGEEQRGKRLQRWRKPWLPGKDGGTMMQSENLREVRTEHRHGRMNSRVRREITCSRSAAVCCVLVWRQRLLRQEESVPEPVVKPTDAQQQHSFQDEREKENR